MSTHGTPIHSATPAAQPETTPIQNIATTPPVVPPEAVWVIPDEQPRPRVDLGEIVRVVYRNPAAAIGVVAAAGLIIGILLKRSLPAARVFDRR
jgi:hypothetical protein